MNLRRWALSWWRAPLIFTMGMLRALALGLIFGGVYWRRPFDQLGIVERLSALYFLSGECLVYVTYDVYIGCVCASVWLVCVCVCVCLCS